MGRKKQKDFTPLTLKDFREATKDFPENSIISAWVGGPDSQNWVMKSLDIQAGLIQDGYKEFCPYVQVDPEDYLEDLAGQAECAKEEFDIEKERKKIRAVIMLSNEP